MATRNGTNAFDAIVVFVPEPSYLEAERDSRLGCRRRHSNRCCGNVQLLDTVAITKEEDNRQAEGNTDTATFLAMVVRQKGQVW